MRVWLLICVMSAWLINQCVAQDWPQWRGPNRDGTLVDYASPASWPEELRLLWKMEVGEGRASPVVADSAVFIHTRRNDQEVVSALSLKDGSLIWSSRNSAPFTKNQYAQSQGEGPFSTPAFHDGRLYTLGINGLLSCFDARTGDLLWRKSFKKQVDTSKLFCGTAMSPLITNGLCIVHVGDDLSGALIAYDAQTGAVKWQWSEQGPGYASPIVVDIDGSRQLVTLTDRAFIGVEVETGKVLWQFPFEDEWNENIVTPVFCDDLLIVSGVRKGTLAIKVSKQADGWSSKIVWQNVDLPMYMSSPVVSAGWLFGLSNKRKGQFFCLNATTGETRWTSEGRAGRNASLVHADRVLFLLTTEGELLIAEKNEQQFKPLQTYTVADSPTWAQPVILSDGILVKDEANLTYWGF